MAREARVARTLVEIADTLVADFDLHDLFEVVVSRSTELLDVSAAGLMLAPVDGRLQLMASSSQSMQIIELFELETEQGPCVDCFQTGRPVMAQDLSAADARWPRFAEEALSAGFRAVHAIPMRLRGDVIGALNLYNEETGGLTPDDIIVAQALADLATIAVLQHRAATLAEQLTANLEYALQSRIVIEQAKGMIAASLDLTVQRSFELLRLHARRNNRRLADVAQAVMDGTLSLSVLAAAPSSN